MRYFIKDISLCTIEKDGAVLEGDGGSIRLAFYDGDSLSVSYRFSGIQVTRQLEDTSAFLTQSRPFMPWTSRPVENESAFVFPLTEGVRIEVEKRYGIVSLYKGSMLVHGGTLGSNDLVVPQYPVRLVADGGRGRASFNFPRNPTDEYYGLGDKSGFPDRSGQRFAMFNRDALGYDAAASDPLYKSIPFYLKLNPEQGTVCGVFLPQAIVTSVDFGRESPYYTKVETEGGPYSYCLFTGESYLDILSAYCRLTGMPALPPLHSFGFLGSSMNYVEPDDAAERVLAFFARTEEEKIPCEGMYFSSGYLKAPDGKRYTFLWNRDKFPDYQGYLRTLQERGYHLIMNIKPGVLTTHPWYRDIDEKGYFIKDKHGKTYVEYYWGGDASFIDFTNPDVILWWKEQLKEQYILHGCEGVWNDNNELELEDSELPAYEIRSVYPVLMSKASYEAFHEHQSTLRPWVYSRAGGSGLQRYARTWTGDNRSDFKTLKFNQYMGASLNLCALFYNGHDLGGFFGDSPEEELLLRSCESGVFQCRFVIHSWRENGVPTEPWTYPAAFERIRSLIYAHYRYMPYIYDCAVHASLTGAPIERLLHLEFPGDKNISSGDTNMLFGPFVLKTPAVAKNVTHVAVSLPAIYDWYDPRTKHLIQGGLVFQKAVPMDGKPHFMIRCGAILPTNDHIGQLTTALLESTTMLLYPCRPGEKSQWEHYEDDGRTEMSLNKWNCFRISLSHSSVTVERVAWGAPASGSRRVHHLKLPQGFLFSHNGESTVTYTPDDAAWEQPIVYTFEGSWENQE